MIFVSALPADPIRVTFWVKFCLLARRGVVVVSRGGRRRLLRSFVFVFILRTAMFIRAFVSLIAGSLDEETADF